jgi:hypothetical protein
MPQSFFVNPAGTSGTVVGVALAPDGSAAAPSYSFASWPNTGMLNSNGGIEFSSQGYITAGIQAGNGVMIAQDYSLQFWNGAFTSQLANFQADLNHPGALTITGTTPMLQFGGTTNAFPALSQNGNQIQAKLADNSGPTYFAGGFYLTYPFLIQTYIATSSPPSISSGFGTAPSIANYNGSLVYVINVGTGGTASSGVIAMPYTSSHGLIAICNDVGNTAGLHTYQTASTTSTLTLTCQNSAGAAAAWAASTLVYVIAMGY